MCRIPTMDLALVAVQGTRGSQCRRHCFPCFVLLPLDTLKAPSGRTFSLHLWTLHSTQPTPALCKYLMIDPQTRALGKLLPKNRTHLKFLLLQNSRSTSVGSLLLRAEIGSETLGWQEETASLGAVGEPGRGGGESG